MNTLFFILAFTVIVSGCQTDLASIKDYIPTHNSVAGEEGSDCKGGYHCTGLTFEEYHSIERRAERGEFDSIYVKIESDVKRTGSLSQKNSELLKKYPQTLEVGKKRYSRERLSGIASAELDGALRMYDFNLNQDDNPPSSSLEKAFEDSYDFIKHYRNLVEAHKYIVPENYQIALSHLEKAIKPIINKYNELSKQQRFERKARQEEEARLEAEKKHREDEQRKFRVTLEEVDRNEVAIRAKLKWSVETQSTKQLELISLRKESAKAQKLEKQIEYLDSEVKKLSFWINALDNKRNIEKQAHLRNDQERMEAQRRQEQARKEDSLRAVAEAATRQAQAAEDAAADARFQNTLNGLNSQINSMNQNMTNNINTMNNTLNNQNNYNSGGGINPTTYYNRVGNSLVGSDGSTCTGVGNAVICR